MKAKPAADARAGEEKAPGGIFGNTAERLTGPPAEAPPASLWERVEGRVAAPKPDAPEGRASLWEHLDQQLLPLQGERVLHPDPAGRQQ